MNSPSFGLIQLEHLDAMWPVVGPMLQRGLNHAHGELDAEDVKAAVLAGSMFVCVSVVGDTVEFAAAFEVVTYPKKTVLNIVSVGGRRLDRLSTTYLPSLEDMARLVGAEEFECRCRPSAARYFLRINPTAEQVYVVLRQKVTV